MMFVTLLLYSKLLSLSPRDPVEVKLTTGCKTYAFDLRNYFSLARSGTFGGSHNYLNEKEYTF